MKHIILIAAVLIVPLKVNAQVSELERSRLNQAAYYNYTEPGDIAITVHVWGAVKYPGLYEIARGLTLSELLSLSGGPLMGERQKRSTHTLSMRVHRITDSGRTEFYSATMTNEILVGQLDPTVQPGDILSIENVVKQGFQWRDAFPVVTMVATLALAFERINN